MTEGMNRNRWAHTASLMAHLANLNRDPKRPAYMAEDFNPMVEERKADLPRMKGVSALKMLLGPNPKVVVRKASRA